MILPEIVKMEISFDELKKPEVQERLAELLDQVFVFKGVGGVLIENKDKAFFKSLIQSLVGQVSKP